MLTVQLTIKSKRQLPAVFDVHVAVVMVNCITQSQLL